MAVANRDSESGSDGGKASLTTSQSEAAEAQESPFVDANGAMNLAVVVEYLRRCRGEAPYIGDVGDFIKICRDDLELDANWLLQSSRAIG